jgi:hypothetical protein
MPDLAALMIEHSKLMKLPGRNPIICCWALGIKYDLTSCYEYALRSMVCCS